MRMPLCARRRARGRTPSASRSTRAASCGGAAARARRRASSSRAPCTPPASTSRGGPRSSCRPTCTTAATRARHARPSRVASLHRPSPCSSPIWQVPPGGARGGPLAVHARHVLRVLALRERLRPRETLAGAPPSHPRTAPVSSDLASPRHTLPVHTTTPTRLPSSPTRPPHTSTATARVCPRTQRCGASCQSRRGPPPLPPSAPSPLAPELHTMARAHRPLERRWSTGRAPTLPRTTAGRTTTRSCGPRSCREARGSTRWRGP